MVYISHYKFIKNTISGYFLAIYKWFSMDELYMDFIISFFVVLNVPIIITQLAGWFTSITPFVLLRIFPFRTFSRPFTLTGFAEIFMPIYCRLYFQLFSGITFLKMGLFLNLGNLNLSVITVSGLYNVTKLDLYDYDCCFFHQINHSRRKNAKKAT